MSTATAVPEKKLPGKPPGEANGKGEELKRIPLGLVVPSKTNPRRRRNAERDAELLESVKRDGVLQAVVLRPRPAGLNDIVFLEERYKKLSLGYDKRAPFGPDDEVFEIIAGERRWEASVKADRPDIPALVRKVDDEKARYLQIIENLQREDISAIDEGRAYRELLSQGKTAQEIAETIGKGKSPRYVYARARLCDLLPGIQDALETGRLSAGHGDLLSRLQPEGQKQALRHMEAMVPHLGEMPTVRDLDVWIKDNIHISLDAGPWKKDDAKLVPEAGACNVCPKNSAVNREVFPDAKRATCTDPACFNAKKAAHQKLVQIEEKKAQPAAPAPASKPIQRPLLRGPEQIAPQAPKLTEKKQDALRRALSGIISKFDPLRKKGATDATIKELLTQMGDGGSSGGTGDSWEEHTGRTNPRIWFSVTRNKKPDLHGGALIAAVRQLLSIRTPEEVKNANKLEQERIRQQKLQEAEKRKQDLEQRFNNVFFSELAEKAKLDAWALRTLGPDMLFEAWDAGLHIDRFAQAVLKWPNPQSGDGRYEYTEVRKYCRRTKFTPGLLPALVLFLHTNKRDFLKHAAHFVNPNKIRRQVQAEMKAAARKKAKAKA